ncbi:MAG: hypothetical protein JW940_27100 [Polyangiaceae bacterium]|nr:hypothetical protein [Polyangiaceae bacterium]
MRVLYTTHNGLTEPLGQSQVLPYLRGLAARGASIDIVSFEPAAVVDADLDRVRAQVHDASLRWRFVRRSPKHDLATKLLEIGKALAVCGRVAAVSQPHIVHTRSYIFGPIIEVLASSVPRSRMLFDCRGLLADEYVDIGYWHEGEARVRAVRRFEAHAFRRAEGLVFLTHRIHDLLRSEGRISSHSVVEVVPCCVDMSKFRPMSAARRALRDALGAGERPVFVYSGSIGSWYLVEEMARFVGALRRRIGPLLWLVVSRSPTEELRRHAQSAGIPPEEIVCRAAAPQDMPRILSCGDVGLSFIKPCFSKLASSPTKVAEYLAAGMPVVVNAGIGDQDRLARKPDAAVVISKFDESAFDSAGAQVERLLRREAAARALAPRAVARSEFDLTDVGIAGYVRLYERLAR